MRTKRVADHKGRHVLYEERGTKKPFTVRDEFYPSWLQKEFQKTKKMFKKAIKHWND